MYKMTTGLRHIATEPGNLNVERMGTSHRKKSPMGKKSRSAAANGSESEGSVDSSPSVASSTEQSSVLKAYTKDTHQKRITRRGSEWEILEGLKEGQRFEQKPDVFSGYLNKKRKWPLKGWHKRFFILDKGLLVYGKGPSEIARGKIHGKVDVGLSVISTKERRNRIDIDAEEFIYHLKTKNDESFHRWVDQLKIHRLYRQHVLTYGSVSGAQDKIFYDLNKPETVKSQVILPVPETVKVRSSPPHRMTSWFADSTNTLERASKELNNVEKLLNQLSAILDQLETAQTFDNEGGVVQDGASSSVKKEKRKFGLRRKKSNACSSSWGGTKTAHADLALSLSTGSGGQYLNNSSPHKAINDATDLASPVSICSATSGLSSYPDGEALSNSSPAIIHNSFSARQLCLSTSSSTQDFHSEQNTADFRISNDFVLISKDVYSNLRSIMNALETEKNRLKTVLTSDSTDGNMQSVIESLQNSLTRSIQQNSDLRMRLSSIHNTSDIKDMPEPQVVKILNSPMPYRSPCVSSTDLFFDAEETLKTNKDTEGYIDNEDRISVPETQGALSDTSSEGGSVSSDDDSASTVSDFADDYNVPPDDMRVLSRTKSMTGRRTKLPCPRPDTEGLSLWNLLRRNIGKDLSQVSMPVALNEPLNMLQRLCEELEYSELLDKAAEIDEPVEQMVCVAAFAVSSYGSAYYRAGSKPFNPLLGETYECVRKDKGFSFVSEQVSHHPPISACYAESKNYRFWQDIRIKTKFWGKSMEFQPLGFVNVKMLRPDREDHYRWNKVTTCLHNLFSDKRWVDLYGELKIANLNRNITCKLTFVKASYWSSKRHEVHGVIIDENGEVVRNLFGKWNEALYCGTPPTARCIWRQGTMPEDHELYYGFTRFAMELNELEPGMENFLPPTDTRFRPDQQFLENGDLEKAELKKQELEQLQRERRKINEEKGQEYEPKWFKKTISENGEETWEFTNKYWEAKENHFTSVQFEKLW